MAGPWWAEGWAQAGQRARAVEERAEGQVERQVEGADLLPLFGH